MGDEALGDAAHLGGEAGGGDVAPEGAAGAGFPAAEGDGLGVLGRVVEGQVAERAVVDARGEGGDGRLADGPGDGGRTGRDERRGRGGAGRYGHVRLLFGTAGERQAKPAGDITRQ